MRPVSQRLDELIEFLKRPAMIVLEFAVPVILAGVVYVGVRAIFQWVFTLHTIAGLIVAGLYCVLASVMLAGFVKKRSELFAAPAWQTLGMLEMTLTMAVSAFSCLSYAMYRLQWSQYTSAKPIEEATLADHYIWQLIDVIPGLKVWSTLGVADPIDGQGIRSGLTLIIFRFFIITPFIALATEWLDFRKKHTAGTATTTIEKEMD